MSKATATATATAKEKVIFLTFNASDMLDLVMIKSKGTQHGIEAFKGFAGLYSQALQGGMKPQLSATTATISACVKAHTSELKALTAAGKAFRKIAPEVVKLVDAAPSRNKLTQDEHDDVMLKISALWAGCFADVAPKAKDTTKETDKQAVQRLQAELASMTMQRDALKALLDANPITAKATAKALDTTALV